MPKKKSKSKQKLSSGTQPEEAGLHYVALSFVTEEMEEMQAHPISGHCVEKIFEFPDCWSKKGLKECHKHIGIISEHAKCVKWRPFLLFGSANPLNSGQQERIR